MAFKRLKPSAVALDTPEALFRDLRLREVEGLLSHQADVLRGYQEHALDHPDVAIELPTGSGKTLVGLLLAEWRRRRNGERPTYLCLTKQLVHQVAEQARTRYGITVHAFTGPQREYNQAAKAAWHAGEAIAVTTYSGLFNTNPVFDSPNLIILDDAHAAEAYVAEMWTLRVHRREYGPLFAALAGVLKGVISPTDGVKLNAEGMDWVEKLPTPTLLDRRDEIVAVLDAHVSGTDLQYRWSLIRDHVHACHLYMGNSELMLRPLIPPTDTHAPFSSAQQRVYMTATLGEGGEIERIAGRKRITRLAVPEGWDRQGIGRRFFIFPSRSLDVVESKKLAIEAAWDMKRALVLVASNRDVEAARKAIEGELAETKVFDAAAIEASKAPFVESERAVAVLAGRYDGIDFPGDECRLIIVDALPRSIHLQERFLIERLGATAAFADRILTRIVQAVGRCTRSATDHSAIILLDEQLQKELLRAELRQLLHPELQAELEFGSEQSKGSSREEMLENLATFAEQGDAWREVDGDIVTLRAQMQRRRPAEADKLKSAVAHEIDYAYALWQGDPLRALEASRQVLTALEGGSETKPYRALWFYLAGSACWAAHVSGHGGMDGQARNYFSRARKAAPYVSWLVALSELRGEDPAPDEVPVTTLRVIERFGRKLEELGSVHDKRFNGELAAIMEGLQSQDKGPFETAHSRLGALLGYEAGNKETPGAPDPWWIADNSLCFIFEDHQGAKPESAVDVSKARQAYTHPNWVRDNLPVSEDAEILPVLITPAAKADSDAMPHLRAVALWRLSDFRAWAELALAVVRDLRRSFSSAEDEAWRKRAVEAFIENQMDPVTLREWLRAQPADVHLS